MEPISTWVNIYTMINLKCMTFKKITQVYYFHQPQGLYLKKVISLSQGTMFGYTMIMLVKWISKLVMKLILIVKIQHTNHYTMFVLIEKFFQPHTLI